MPANTIVNVNRATHTYLDTTKLQDEYVNKMSSLLFVPNASASKGAGEANKRQKTEASGQKPKNDNLERIMSFTGNISRICSDMESLMATVNTFCECSDVEALIETYQKESIERHKGIAKHRHSLLVQRNSYAIPLQLLKLGPSKNNCKITLSAEVCTVFFSAALYKDSFMSCDTFLDFIMKTTNMQGLSMQIDPDQPGHAAPKPKTSVPMSAAKQNSKNKGNPPA